MSIKKHIPNTITSLNLLSGSISIIFTFYGDFKAAFLCIIAAAVFDFFDGFSARLLKAYSPMGKELDSLADMVSFGLAPAFILFNKLLLIFGVSFPEIFTLEISVSAIYLLALFCTLLVAVFSALRLGKFNIDVRQSENFIGLATPSCSLLIGSFIYATEKYPALNLFVSEQFWILPLAAILLSLLLTSEIPMFSFKFKSLAWKENASRFIFLGIVALLGIITVLLGWNWCLWVFFIFIVYILINVTACLFRQKPASSTK